MLNNKLHKLVLTQIHKWINLLYLVYYVTLVQIQDYGCALKMNNCQLVLDLLVKMYKVFIMLDCKLYARSIYMHLQVLHYHKMQDSFFWTMFQENVCAFNEEGGEISFSVLSRCVLGDTTKMKFDHVSDLYMMQPVYREINIDIQNDIDAPLMKRTISKISTSSPEVLAIAAYFTTMIRELETGVGMIYTGTKKSYKRKNSEMKVLHPNDDIKYLWIDDSTVFVNQHSMWFEDKIATFDLNRYAHIWPESIQVISPPRDGDIELKSDDIIEMEGTEDEDEIIGGNSDSQVDVRDIGDDEVNSVAQYEGDDEQIPSAFGVEIEENDDNQEHNAGYGSEDDDFECEVGVVQNDDYQPRVCGSMEAQYMREVQRLSPHKRRRQDAFALKSFPIMRYD